MKNPWPNDSEIAFAVRDDDIGFFTSPQRLQKVYHQIWERGFKISLATIPLQKGTNNPNVPPPFRGDNEYHPISQNKELVAYLKGKISQGKVDIVQHGFSHTENSNLPALRFDLKEGNLSAYNGQKVDLSMYSEFYGADKREVGSKVKEGKDILEQVFGAPIRVFTSPQELLTRDLWIALWKNGLSYCGSIDRKVLSQIPPYYLNLYPLLKVAAKRILSASPESIVEDETHLTDITILPTTCRHYWNNFTSEKSAEKYFDSFKTLFDEKRKKGGYFILLTHNWEYFYDWEDEVTQKRQLEYLNKIIAYVDETSGVWKSSLSELSEWFKTKRTMRSESKGNHCMYLFH